MAQLPRLHLIRESRDPLRTPMTKDEKIVQMAMFRTYRFELGFILLAFPRSGRVSHASHPQYTPHFVLVAHIRLCLTTSLSEL